MAGYDFVPKEKQTRGIGSVVFLTNVLKENCQMWRDDRDPNSARELSEWDSAGTTRSCWGGSRWRWVSP